MTTIAFEEGTVAPERRLGVGVLITRSTERGREVLMAASPTRHPENPLRWELPAAYADEGELLIDVAARATAGAGLVRRLAHVLVVDQVPESEGGTPETIHLVVDGGMATRSEAAAAVGPDGASALRWLDPGDLDQHCVPREARRVRAAVDAQELALRLPALVCGTPMTGASALGGSGDAESAG